MSYPATERELDRMAATRNRPGRTEKFVQRVDEAIRKIEAHMSGPHADAVEAYYEAAESGDAEAIASARRRLREVMA